MPAASAAPFSLRPCANATAKSCPMGCDPLGVTNQASMPAGNLRMLVTQRGKADAPRLLIGSHLDTVPNAGAYDGVLGVVLAHRSAGGVARARASLRDRGGRLFRRGRRTLRRLRSSAAARSWAAWMRISLTADATWRISVREAIEDFGLNPARFPDAASRRRCSATLNFTSNKGRCLRALESAAGSGRGHRRTKPAGVHFPWPRQPRRHNADASSP